jgi:hypothetical protein
MNPLTGLMKMLEMGMEKGGIRDSMATRQANAAAQAVDMTQNPYMSAASQSPMSILNPNGLGAGMGTPMNASPVEPPAPVNAGPDGYDKMMDFISMLGPGGSLQNPNGGLPQQPSVAPRAGTPLAPVQNLNPQSEGGGLMAIIKMMAGGA